jgi:hypothetical protein
VIVAVAGLAGAAGACSGPDLPYWCGDGQRGRFEECDGDDLGAWTCPSLGFSGGGVLRCTAACRFDTRACVPGDCGNDRIDPGEVCDGTALEATCESLGLPGTPKLNGLRFAGEEAILGS